MKRFKNILLVADDGSWQETALQRAVALAEHNQSDLTIIHTLHFPRDTALTGDSVYGRLKSAIIEERQQQLRKILSVVDTTGIDIMSRVIEGQVFPEIIREVLRNGYDLVIKCAEETSWLRDRIFGSTDMHLLRKCPCPVWIVKPHEKTTYQRILAAVDVGQGKNDQQINSLNQQILELASSLALSEFSEFHIIHTWTAWGESLLNTPRFNFTGDSEMADWVEQQRVVDKTKVQDLMQELTETLSRETMGYLKPQIHILKGEAHKIIPKLALEKKVDLVVMGTVGRTGIPGLIMGNTAESILNGIGCSVLAVKPPGFISPVTTG